MNETLLSSVLSLPLQEMVSIRKLFFVTFHSVFKSLAGYFLYVAFFIRDDKEPPRAFSSAISF